MITDHFDPMWSQAPNPPHRPYGSPKFSKILNLKAFMNCEHLYGPHSLCVAFLFFFHLGLHLSPTNNLELVQKGHTYINIMTKN